MSVRKAVDRFSSGVKSCFLGPNPNFLFTNAKSISHELSMLYFTSETSERQAPRVRNAFGMSEENIDGFGPRRPRFHESGKSRHCFPYTHIKDVFLFNEISIFENFPWSGFEPGPLDLEIP